MRRVKKERLRGASLLETIVAAVLFLAVFAALMELIPRLTVRDDEALVTAEAEYRAARAFDKYGSEAKRRCAWSRIGNTMTCNS